MGLFDWLFGSKDPVAGLKKALEREAWAEALSYREDLALDDRPEAERAELEALLAQAGDALARVNLEEAQACLRLGDANRAEEHFELASRQACSRELAQEITKARKARPAAPPAAPVEERGTACRPAQRPLAPEEEHTGFDAHIELELVLASYPEEWAVRYRELPLPVVQAVLTAHQGHYQEAVKAFERVPRADQNDIYHFELGALHARSRRNKLARTALKEALRLNPGHPLALETLVRLELQAEQTAAAEKILAPYLEGEEVLLEALSLQAMVLLQKGEVEAAIACGRQAVSGGYHDPELMVLLASMLERQGEAEEAERLLTSLGPLEVNLHLAELYLRRGKNPGKLIDVFKAALKQDPENPRWRLRLAQAYIVKGWIKEAEPLLAPLAEDRSLPDMVKLEVAETLKALQARKK